MEVSELNQGSTMRVCRQLNDGRLRGNSFNQRVRTFIEDNLPTTVKVERNTLEEVEEFEANYEVGAVYSTVETTRLEDTPNRYQEKAVICTKDSEMNEEVTIPLNDIDWNKAIADVIEEQNEDLEDLLNLNFDYDIELPEYQTLSFELEGGFDRDGFGRALGNLGLQVTGDGSVSTPAYYDDREVKVDGYCTGDEVLGIIEAMQEVLDDYEFISNDSCGIHVHLGNANEFTGEELLKITKLFAGVEKYIYHYIPNGRLEGSWAKPMPIGNPDLFEFIKRTEPGDLDDESIKQELETSLRSRGSGINLKSYFYRGSIEFRYFDADRYMLPYYIDWVSSIVDYAVNNDDIIETIVEIQENPEVMFDKFDISEESIDKITSLSGPKILDEFENLYEGEVADRSRLMNPKFQPAV